MQDGTRIKVSQSGGRQLDRMLVTVKFLEYFEKRPRDERIEWLPKERYGYREVQNV